MNQPDRCMTLSAYVTMRLTGSHAQPQFLNPSPRWSRIFIHLGTLIIFGRNWRQWAENLKAKLLLKSANILKQKLHISRDNLSCVGGSQTETVHRTYGCYETTEVTDIGPYTWGCLEQIRLGYPG